MPLPAVPRAATGAASATVRDSDRNSNAPGDVTHQACLAHIEYRYEIWVCQSADRASFANEPLLKVAGY